MAATQVGSASSPGSSQRSGTQRQQHGDICNGGTLLRYTTKALTEKNPYVFLTYLHYDENITLILYTL